MHLLNTDVVPFHEEHGEPNKTVSDKARAFSVRPDRHLDEVFLQLEGIEQRKTQVRRPQSNGIIECLHRTLLDAGLGSRLPSCRRHSTPTSSSTTRSPTRGVA